jgi:imidazoleglycerol phosphate synthase glutamine amidotransferase subunit HisH
LKEKEQVYHLHNYYADFSKIKEFVIYSGNEIPQAVKHRSKKIYGVLFHPEVRQKSLILRFAEEG